jgi:N-acetylneuraminate lyase
MSSIGRPIGGAFGGIWPALLTPLTEAGEPNHEALEQLVELYLSQGLGGLFILGSTGQWPLLTLNERQAIAQRVIKTSAGRIPVMVHVGATTTDDAISLARHAARAGADAVSCVAPIYYSMTADAIFEHYRRVASATALPFFVYHFSATNQLTIGPREYAERLLALPNIVGMKFTDGDLGTLGLLHTYTRGRLALLVGADELFCHAAASGAAGAVGMFFNLWGPACQAAWQAMVSGDVDKARRFMLGIQETLADVCRPGRMWSFLRSAMRIKYQIDIGLPRPPLGLLAEQWQDAEVEPLIAQVDELVPLVRPR